jgi:hypothetical protein
MLMSTPAVPLAGTNKAPASLASSPSAAGAPSASWLLRRWVGRDEGEDGKGDTVTPVMRDLYGSNVPFSCGAGSHESWRKALQYLVIGFRAAPAARAKNSSNECPGRCG